MTKDLSRNQRHTPRTDGEAGPETSTMKRPKKGGGDAIRWLSIAVIVIALLTIMRLLPFNQALDVASDWISALGVWGPVVLGLLYVIATVFFVPGTILTLAAGALFGLGVGFITVSAGSTVGAALAFLIARYVARNKVAEIARHNRKFGAIDRAIGEGGWKIVALLRLSPAIPFNLQNYLYGLTPVRFWPYVLTSWLAMMPGTFLYVYLGHITKAAVGGDRARTPAEWAMLGVGLLATIAVTVYITRLARQKLNEQVEDESGNTVAEPGTDDPTPGEGRSSAAMRNTSVLAITAIVLAGVAVFVYWNSDAIEQRLASLFGPPQVELSEAYSRNPTGPSVDHSVLNSLLQDHVDADGWVDYDGIARDETLLDEYLDVVADAPFESLGRDEKLALLINAYNAFTLKLILDKQPIVSIMDIPEAERWDAVRWKVGGRVWSLNQIEHEEIRPKFVEPRVHFVLVCAAVGCPPLRNEAYEATMLEQQLASQSEYVHGHSTWFEFDPQSKRVRLTKLYNWYGGDFEQTAGSVLEYAASYSPKLDAVLNERDSPRIEWLPYDWKLNSTRNRQPR